MSVRAGNVRNLSCDRSARVVRSAAGQRATPVRKAADVNDLGVIDREDLVQALGRGGPRSFGPAGHGEPEDDSITVDFDTLDAGHGAISEQSPVPVQYFPAVPAQAGPLDLLVQDRREQFEVLVP